LEEKKTFFGFVQKRFHPKVEKKLKNRSEVESEENALKLAG